MKAPVSLPSIEISADRLDEGFSFFPKIRAYANGYSLGLLALTSFNDLFLLRDIIDRFIETNNIHNKMKEEKQKAPTYASVIAGVLLAQGYRPTNRENFNAKTMRVMTSQEIILDLADMVDLELNDVASAMLHLGYCTTAHEGKVGWLLLHKSAVGE